MIQQQQSKSNDAEQQQQEQHSDPELCVFYILSHSFRYPRTHRNTDYEYNAVNAPNNNVSSPQSMDSPIRNQRFPQNNHSDNLSPSGTMT